MNDIRKARVGLLGLMFDLYDAWPDLKPAMAGFGANLATDLTEFADVDFPGVCNSREQVDAAVARFDQGQVDLILVVLLTYAPSHIALPALLATQLPVVIFNTQQLLAVGPGTQGIDTTHNHGMHGVQDLANVLVRAGRGFHIVTGHFQDPRALAEVRSWCDAARVAADMRRLKIGLVGYPMQGMGDFALDETAFLVQAGVRVHHLPMKMLGDLARGAPASAIEGQMAADRELFEFDSAITQQEHEASARLEWALRELLCRSGCQGFASHFLAVGEESLLDTLPFLAASKLLGEGFGFGGEGDVTSAAAVCMMQRLAGQANFTEMFTMDFAGNAILMMHMGEGNWRMARRDEPVRVVRSSLEDIMSVRVSPLLLAFALEPGEATLVSLTTVDRGRMRIVVSEGAVLDHPYIPALQRPHFKYRPAGDLCAFLARFSEAGGSHHQALANGRWASTVEKIAGLLNVECVRV